MLFRSYAGCAGIIQNSRNVENEDALVSQAARECDTEVIKIIPRHPLVQQAENQGMTVIEAFPDSDMAQEYQMLADKVLEVTKL